MNLTLTVDELRILELAGWAVDGMFDELPAAAVEALARIRGAQRAGVTTVYKVPRDSLQALADAVRAILPRSPKDAPAIRPVLAKVDARLKSQRGKRANAQQWQERAEAVRAAAKLLAEANGYPPTDNEIAAHLGELPDAIGKWRWRHPDLFPRRD